MAKKSMIEREKKRKEWWNSTLRSVQLYKSSLRQQHHSSKS
jgi:hypothetical protein